MNDEASLKTFTIKAGERKTVSFSKTLLDSINSETNQCVDDKTITSVDCRMVEVSTNIYKCTL